MAWTLKFGEEEKSFEDWGFSNLHRRTPNRRPDVVTFVAEDVLFDEDPEFGFDNEIEIFNDGVRWFAGRVKDVKRQASGEAESIQYECQGVLGWLNDLTFHQPWKYRVDYQNPSSELTTLYFSNLVLFQKIDGSVAVLQNIREQIEEIFAYIISQWETASIEPKFQLDSSKAPSHEVPYQEVFDVSCAQALEHCFATCPDLAMWVDYSTDIPTVRIARRGITADYEATPDNYLEAVDLEISDEGEGDDSIVVKADVQARNDLKPPSVTIQYLQNNSVNGSTTRFTTTDTWPIDSDTRAFKAVKQTVQLDGTSLSFPQETLSVRTIDALSGDAIAAADWWRLHETALAKPNIAALTIRGATRSGSLPYELLPNSGPWSPWMGGQCEEDLIECYASWERREMKTVAAGSPPVEVVVEKIFDQLLQVRVMTTSKVSGTYQGPASGSLGEPVPTGLARALFEVASESHYEGSLTLEESECSGLIGVGNTVNLQSSRRPEWSTMRAMVHQVEEDIFEGRTTITLGPVELLSADDVLRWLRGLRSANQGLWASRSTGLNYSGGAFRIASRGHKQSLSAGKEARERLVLMRPDSATQTAQTMTAKIILDVVNAGGKEIMLREVTVCDNGVEKKMIILASEIY